MKDDENIQKIIKGLSGLPFISAIIITINGTVARFSTSIRTTLSQLRGSLPDSVFENLFFVFTNCEETTRSFDLTRLAEYNPKSQRTFHMQNSIFCVDSMDKIDSDGKKKRRTETNWQDSMETISDLMDEVGRTVATSTKIFDDMRIKREQLLVDKENLITKQKNLLSIMHQLSIQSDRLKNAQTHRTANKDHWEKKVIEKVEIEKKSYYSTVCNDSKHGQLQVCHENCGLGYQATLNYDHFKNCAASDGTNCRHCKCSMNTHYHTYEIPSTKQVTIDEIIQSKKAAFDQATQQISDSQSQLGQLNHTKSALQNDVHACKQGILNAIRALKAICSHYNFPEEMAATIQKLRQESKIAQDLTAKTEFNNTADAIENLVKQLAVIEGGESGTPVINRRSGVRQNTAGAPWNTNGAQQNTAGAPWNTNGPQQNTTGPPWNTNGAQQNTAGAPWNTNGAQWNTNGAQQNTAGAPWNTNGAQQNTAGAPWNTNGPQQNTTGPPWNTNGPQQNTTGPPWNTNGPQQNTTGAPWNTNGAQQNTAGAPWNTNGAQQNTTGAPWNTNGPQQNTTRAPWNTNRVQRIASGIQENINGVQQSASGAQQNTSGIRRSKHPLGFTYFS